ncbi:MAG: hypothetical protein IJU25_04110 [Lachnospiraceae bacterium]|nr:hypothetical protein [Lachnospiraceae bacterium]
MKDIINELTDLRYLNWTKSRRSSGTAGTFLKSYDDTDVPKRYYKLSDFDAVHGIVGHECVNEIIAQRLLQLFDIAHLNYRLIHALISIGGVEYETFLCESVDFKAANESKIPLEDYYAMERQENEPPFDFCVRMGWEGYVQAMLTVDYLILNRDRHGANIEVLINGRAHAIRLAPLFDHGLSLVCSCRDKDTLDAFDVMEDRKVQAFIGSQSTQQNLIRMVPKEYLKKLGTLSEKDMTFVLSGLESALDRDYLNKIREMIMRRWRFLDDFRNS